MSAEQRLDRLYPALSAKERALLVLHAVKEDVALKLAWLQTLHLWSGETNILGALLLKHGKTLPADARRDVRKLVKRAPSFADAPFDLERPFSDVPVRGAGFGDELAWAVAFGLQNALLDHWREIRAIEVVVEEARDEFDGEDPLHPDVRRLLDEAKTTLLEVHAGFGPYVTGIALPEPGNEEVGLVRRLIDKAIENS